MHKEAMWVVFWKGICGNVFDMLPGAKFYLNLEIKSIIEVNVEYWSLFCLLFTSTLSSFWNVQVWNRITVYIMDCRGMSDLNRQEFIHVWSYVCYCQHFLFCLVHPWSKVIIVVSAEQLYVCLLLTARLQLTILHIPTSHLPQPLLQP